MARKRRPSRTAVGARELAVRQQFQGENICGSITRAGTPCLNPAGKGTDHQGVGPCKQHDAFKGVALRQPGKRYADGVADNALAFYLELVNDPEIKSVDEEIALLRFRLDDINQMVEEIRARNVGDDGEPIMLPRAYGEKADPAGTADHKAILALMRDSAKVAESISKLIDRKHKIEEGKLVTYRQVQEVLAQVIYVIKKNCDGCAQLGRMAEDFASIDVSKFE